MTVHISGARAILDRWMADPEGAAVIHNATRAAGRRASPP